MTERNEFSLNIPVKPATGFEPLPDWVAFDLCKAYPATDGNLLLHNTRNGQRAMVRPEVYASLLSCKKFKTLDQHVANIIARNPGMRGQQADIRNVLDTMLKSGIMVSAKNTADDLKRKPAPESGKKEPLPPIVAIITWERPQALERLLQSIVDNCATEKLQCLYVIDDSRKTDNIHKNKGIVDLFSPRLSTPLRYIGQTEQQSLLDKLAGQLPQHEDAIRFLADQTRWSDHWTSGLARNLALLLSCGRRLVMMDDDSLCDVYNPRQSKPNITFSDNPRDADFFATQQEWAARHQPINPDPVNRHMQCLGLSFSEALEVLGKNNLKPGNFAGSTALLLNQLKTDSPILTTECGSIGCPGTGQNTWLPEMAPESLKLMLSSELKTNNALNSRQVWSGRNNPHFSPRSNMSAMAGFDNLELLPPYLPILRGEDRLFGYMLNYIFPNAISLDYPWAVPHIPIPERDWEKEHRDFTPYHSFPQFFFEKVVDQKPLCIGSSPIDRMKALSAWFGDLAAASDDTLKSMYKDTRLHSISASINHLSHLVETGESAPQNWKNYLGNGIQQLGVAMEESSRKDFPIKGVPSALQGSELIAFWKDVWSGFAAALQAWPEIRAAATDIIEKDFPRTG